MAWRPEHLVKSGEIDNTQLGWTVGWLEMNYFMMQLDEALENQPSEDDDA